MARDTDRDNPLEIEPAASAFEPQRDSRPKLVPPPPVKLMAVEDVTLPAPAGAEAQLDRFYVRLLQFEREADEGTNPVYRGEKHRLHFTTQEPPLHRRSLRPVTILIPSLADAEQKLIDAEIDYTRQRGLTPGEESIVLLDPAGNWIELTEAPQVR